MLMNDVGSSNVDGKPGLKCARKPRKTHHNKSDNRTHRDVWELARNLYETCSVRIEIFVKFSDNTNVNSGREIERTCK